MFPIAKYYFSPIIVCLTFFFFIRLTWYLLPQLVLNAIRNISLQTVVQTFPNESVYAIYRMFSIENSSRYALRQIELSNYQKQQYIILYGRVGTSYTSHTVRIIPLGRSEWNLMEYNNFKWFGKIACHNICSTVYTIFVQKQNALQIYCGSRHCSRCTLCAFNSCTRVSWYLEENSDPPGKNILDYYFTEGNYTLVEYKSGYFYPPEARFLIYPSVFWPVG